MGVAANQYGAFVRHGGSRCGLFPMTCPLGMQTLASVREDAKGCVKTHPTVRRTVGGRLFMSLIVRTIRGPKLVQVVERCLHPVITPAVAHCIVCEQTGAWAVALRDGLAADLGRLAEVRGWTAALDALRAAPASIVVAEVSNIDLVTWAERGATLQLVFPQSHWLAVGTTELWDCERDWRQIGALELVDSSRAVARILPIIRRHLKQHPPARPSLRQRIWERLPWADCSYTQPEGSIHDR